MHNIYYRNIPEGYRQGDSVYLFGFEFSGIQKFIFNVTEQRGSLRQIKENSVRIEQLTDIVYERIKTIHSVRPHELITKTSGKVYFIAANDVEINRLNEILEEVQHNVFVSFKGALRLYYGHVKAQIKTKMETGDSAYKALSERLALSRRKNFNLLMNDDSHEHHNYNTPISLAASFTIDKLIRSDQKHRYITGIKLDFDDLGKYFGSVGFSDVVQTQSAIMMEKINDVLAKHQEVYKVFAGGDDIFILVNFYQAFNVLVALYEELEETFAELDYNFGLSAGMVHFKEKTSIIYYGEQLENELNNAKLKGKGRASLENTCFTWNDFKDLTRSIEQNKECFGKDERKSSQLSAFENTMKAILTSDGMRKEKVRRFILKIPLFESRLPGLVPKALLSLDLQRIERYFHDVTKFYFSVKYASRLIEKEL